MVTGFVVTIKIGVNGNSKDEVLKLVGKWVKAMGCPVLGIEVTK